MFKKVYGGVLRSKCKESTYIYYVHISNGYALKYYRKPKSSISRLQKLYVFKKEKEFHAAILDILAFRRQIHFSFLLFSW